MSMQQADDAIFYEVQYSESRNAVWVHASDGSTVGRFGRNGIDIHTTVSEQLAGAPQCRLCTHSQPTLEDWNLFREKALEFWGVAISPDGFDEALLANAKRTGEAYEPEPI